MVLLSCGTFTRSPTGIDLEDVNDKTPDLTRRGILECRTMKKKFKNEFTLEE